MEGVGFSPKAVGDATETVGKPTRYADIGPATYYIARTVYRVLCTVYRVLRTRTALPSGGVVAASSGDFFAKAAICRGKCQVLGLPRNIW